ELKQKLIEADDERVIVLAEAIRRDISLEDIHGLTKIDRFFLTKIKHIIEYENKLKKAELTDALLLQAKRTGLSDVHIARCVGTTENAIYERRIDQKMLPVYKMVDTCAGEFPSEAPYFYSTYEEENESESSDRKKVLVLGSGPIRIGQGIEFDYATVHSVLAIREMGYEAIIINNNPETVSTDFTIS